MANHPNRSTTGPDLAVIINRDTQDSRKTSVRILPLAEHEEANPHMPAPTEHGFSVQVGPIYNNQLTTIGRAANRKEAGAMLRREEVRLGLPNGVLRPRDDSPQF